MRNRILTVAGLAVACVAGCGAAEPAGDGMTLHVYDVRDLRAPTDFPGMEFPGTEVKLEATGPPSATSLPDDAETLAATLRALPGLGWAAPRALEARAGTLVVRQDAPGHAQVADWLRGLRASCARLVEVEAYFVARPGVVLPADGTVRHLSGSEGEAWLAGIQRETGASLICAPRLTLFDGQRGNITLARQLSYVSGYERRAEAADQPGDPVVKTVQEGQVLDVRGEIGADGQVALDVTVTLAGIDKPIPSLETPDGAVQVPRVHSQTRRCTAAIPDGHWALLTGFVERGDAGPTGRHVEILLRPAVVRLSDTQAPARK